MISWRRTYSPGARSDGIFTSHVFPLERSTSVAHVPFGKSPVSSIFAHLRLSFCTLEQGPLQLAR